MVTVTSMRCASSGMVRLEARAADFRQHASYQGLCFPLQVLDFAEPDTLMPHACSQANACPHFPLLIEISASSSRTTQPKHRDPWPALWHILTTTSTATTPSPELIPIPSQRLSSPSSSTPVCSASLRTSLLYRWKNVFTGQWQGHLVSTHLEDKSKTQVRTPKSLVLLQGPGDQPLLLLPDPKFVSYYMCELPLV